MTRTLSIRPLASAAALLLCLAVAPAGAQTPAPNGENNKVPSELFMQIMATSAPKLLCNNEQSPLRRCLKLNLEKCMSEVSAVTPACVKRSTGRNAAGTGVERAGRTLRRQAGSLHCRQDPQLQPDLPAVGSEL